MIEEIFPPLMKLFDGKKQAWTRRSALRFAASLLVAACFAIALDGCKGKDEIAGTSAPKVIQVADMNLITVDPE